MKGLNTHYEPLAFREGFNSSVRHIKAMIGALSRFESRENLGDIVNELLESKAISQDEIPAVLSLALQEKYPYTSVAGNITAPIQNTASPAEEIKNWNGVDSVVVYHHPDVGILLLNPKNPESLSLVDRYTKNELIVVYTGTFTKSSDSGLMGKAAQAILDIFEGKTPKILPSFLKGECSYRAPRKKSEAIAIAPKKREPKLAAPKPGRGRKPAVQAQAEVVQAAAPEPVAVQAPPPPVISAARHMTPMYSVPVTNELFHNGNVEAWKRIITSYTVKYPYLQVFVYYDGERITDLNTLFKWGKVKRGTSIQFAIVGDNFQDIAKLLRYLKQGASHMFEAFLRGPVNSVMQLF